MPIYDYLCGECDHRFELKQSFDSEPIATCPQCRNSAARQFHAVPVVFKGSGWYVTDYGKRGANSDSPSESKDSKDSKDSSDSGSKSESKKPSASKSGSKDKSESKAAPATGKAKDK